VGPVLVAVLSIEVVILVFIRYESDFIRILGTLLCKGAGRHAWYIPEDTGNKIRAAFAVDVGPFGVAAFATGLRKGLGTLSFGARFGEFPVIKRIGKAVLRIFHAFVLIVGVGVVGGFGPTEGGFAGTGGAMLGTEGGMREGRMGTGGVALALHSRMRVHLDLPTAVGRMTLGLTKPYLDLPAFMVFSSTSFFSTAFSMPFITRTRHDTTVN